MRLAINLTKVELKMSQDAVTGKMGLAWLTHSMKVFGLENIVSDGYRKKSNRETDRFKKIMSVIMTRVAGGERVEDIENLRVDKGLLESLGWEEMMNPDTYLNFINNRRSNARLRSENNKMIIKALKKIDEEELTYDNDATYFDSEKDSANYSYQKRKQFSGLIGSFEELGMINTVDFRRGNVSPQTGIMNQLKKATAQAEVAGKRVGAFRSDSAAYRTDIMTYCDKNKIRYFISGDKDEAVKERIIKVKERKWKMLEEKYSKNINTKWAEIRHKMSKGFTIRMMVLRWPNPDPDLFNVSPYCYHVIATNDFEIDPMKWLKKHNGRMGTIEHSNGEIKNGLGCNYAPSHEFEKNRGYFLIGILAYNMLEILKRFYLGVSTIKWRVKKMRYQFINVCGKITKSGRKFSCHIINVTNEVFELFRHCKTRLSMVVH